MTQNQSISTKFFYALLLGAILTLSGCAAADKQKRMNHIDITLSDFRKAIRWGYFEDALRYIQVKDYSEPLRDPDYLKNIRITSYEYGNKSYSEDDTKLNVIALISYYDVNQGTVNDIAVDQVWWFDPEKKRWFLDGDIPDMSQ
jgi:hypothetical protein